MFSNDHPRMIRAVYMVCYALLGLLFLYVVVARYVYPLALSDSIEVVGKADEVEQRIDPNAADWPELARLPGIGEVLSKRIIQYRQEHSAGARQPVFQSPQDLEAVSGIGPKLAERIGPFLKFSAVPAAETAPH